MGSVFGFGFGAAGGLGYHVLARRFRSKLWREFTTTLATWLHAWPQRHGALLLVGPSAGYTLPAPFLARYSELRISEPDFLARLIFRQRFSAMATATEHARFFDHEPCPGGPWVRIEGERRPTRSRRFRASGWHALVSLAGSHDILFCNLLGQLAVLHPQLTWEPGWSASFSELARTFDRANCHWASYHDRLSADLGDGTLTRSSSPELAQRWLERPHEAGIDAETAAQMPIPRASDARLREIYLECEGGPAFANIRSHATQVVFPRDAGPSMPTHARYWMWPLTATRRHVIEGLTSTGPCRASSSSN